MACLSAGEASPLAWEILATGADAFVTIEDSFAPRAMKALARGTGNDPRMVAGESGASGLAALIAASESPAARRALGDLGPDSDVLLIASEGATDPAIYTQIVGRTPEEVGESL